MPKTIKARRKPKHFYVVGQKDPRGPDNTITIYLDEQGRLVIQVQKPHVRCYPFSHIEESSDYVRIIQNR